ncbi:acyltransferase family protein [Paenibacillus soyae]|uniref:Acyltransferase family protein n=1 Tax=Paenibacillus soyae TaxID=2969249 RepID=A0A9X2SD23_9BACL|nr:acyltransferase family protein [Paenibacillus soyae]MCR2807398.1 acyltransferase family protein [Paenibacillus soyae]
MKYSPSMDFVVSLSIVNSFWEVVIISGFGEKRKRITEVESIRAIACLCVVLLHSIKYTVGFELSEESTLTDEVFLSIAGILAFGTPTFVFISELILARSYPLHLPDGFYWKRIKFILFPFITCAVIYAVADHYGNPTSIPTNIVVNLLGGYHGWFVLVVFQFYILHKITAKYLYKHRPITIISVSLFVNIMYLGIFNLVTPKSTAFTDYFWDRGFWALCLGWVFYFFIAYYCGKNYEYFIQIIRKYQIWIYSSLPLTLAIILFDNQSGIFGYGSKRMDMIPFTINIVLVLFLIFSRLSKQPSFLLFVSKYSYGIYLVHLLCLMVINKTLGVLGINLGYGKMMVLFVSAVVTSIIIIKLVNIFSFGKYLVGANGNLESRETGKRRKYPVNV